MSRHHLILKVLLLAALGCGGSEPEPSDTGGPVPSLTATKTNAMVEPSMSVDSSVETGLEASSVELVTADALTDEQQQRLDEVGFVVIAEDGSVVDATAEKVDAKADPQVTADVCGISYVDCTDKKTYTVSLKKGSTFIYGDWDGTKCVQKTFKCK